MMLARHEACGLLWLVAMLSQTIPACGASWEEAASLHVTREYPGLAVMRDGHVLAVSGHPLADWKSLASAELYDPQKNTWRPTGSLNVARNGVQPGGLITLPDGKVLIAGGGSGNRSVHEAELYDYERGEWSTTGSMATPRCVHTMTLLDDGTVLATGGIDWLTNDVHKSAERYDHKSGKWNAAGSMHTPRFNHGAVKLADGSVLVLGGHRDSSEKHVVADAEIYDPRQGTWRKVAPMNTARRTPAAVRLQDGRVLVAGGASGSDGFNRQLAEAEVFDPQTERWTSVAPLSESRWGPTVDLLPDGRVLVTGGGIGPPYRARRSAELFDPETNTWSDAGNLRQARNGHRSIALQDGRVFIVGGHYVGRYLDECELYTP